jgi:hypothetical protein
LKRYAEPATVTLALRHGLRSLLFSKDGPGGR